MDKKNAESYISMGLGLLVVIVVGVLIFNYFNRNNPKLTLPGIQAPTGEGQGAMQKNLPAVHMVSTGETLWSIANAYYQSGYNWVSIAKENNLSNANYLMAGQKLTIPKAEKIAPPAETAETAKGVLKEESYTVVKGDNLWQIAVRAYGDGYQWAKIAQANNLANPNLIHPGNVLKLPR